MGIKHDEFRKPTGLITAAAITLAAARPGGKVDVFGHASWVWDEMLLGRRPKGGKLCLFHPSVASHVPPDALMTRTLKAIACSDKSYKVWPVGSDYDEPEVADRATGRWVRVVWEHNSKLYVANDVDPQPSEPEWPFESFEAMIEQAFAGLVIDNPDHPILREILEARHSKAS